MEEVCQTTSELRCGHSIRLLTFHDDRFTHSSIQCLCHHPNFAFDRDCSNCLGFDSARGTRCHCLRRIGRCSHLARSSLVSRKLPHPSGVSAHPAKHCHV